MYEFEIEMCLYRSIVNHSLHFNSFLVSFTFPKVMFSVTSQFINAIYHCWILQSLYLHTGTCQATHWQAGWGLGEEECECECEQERQSAEM